MDARGISVDLGLSSGRKVVAKKRCVIVNSVKKMQMREISSSKRYRGFSIAEERFRNFHLQEEYNTYGPEEEFPLSLSFLNPRSKIIEVFATDDVVFALAEFGVCAAFSRATKMRICFLNVNPDEVINSLFYNQINDSLITISIRASDSFSSLICRSTKIEYIRSGEPHVGFQLFESESIKWPSFVEFDDVNGKVIMHCAEHKLYKVFDLENYALLYTILDKNIQEIKISPGILLLVYKITRSSVPLKIVSVEDGTHIKSFNHILHKNKNVVLIEQFNEKLLVKQENENLQIVDVQNYEVIEVKKTESMAPYSFIFLYENQLFLTLTNQTVTLWNLRGELVTSFEDHVFWHPDFVYVTNNGDILVSYCKSNSVESSSDGNAGSIIISSILTGKCIGKITASNSRKQIQTSKITSTVAEALDDITSLFYDEERNEFYTGSRLGRVHVWAN